MRRPSGPRGPCRGTVGIGLFMVKTGLQRVAVVACCSMLQHVRLKTVWPAGLKDNIVLIRL